MSLFDVFRKKAPEKRSAVFLTDDTGFETICAQGYTSLDKCPEVLTACRQIADIISSMTIHLYANSEKGDVRIHNELSKKVDIYPSNWMTRKTWMDAIVMNLLLYGKGNSVVLPHTSDGYLEDLEVVSPSRVGFIEKPKGYKVLIDGHEHDPNDVMHFVLNPNKLYPWKGDGLTAALNTVADNLKQAAATEQGFMKSKWKPSLIIKVDALTDEFSSPTGRKKLLEDYISTSSAGEPWMIPADQFSVEQVRPLSLSDLALSDMVTLDKKTVASIIGVPAFVVGVGNYKAAEWNSFINNRVRPIAREIEQEMTRKLLISPKMYWRFNIASQYAYDIKELSNVYGELYVRGIVTGNEVRDKMSMQPKDGLDELVILENYVPIDRIGDQKKLKDSDEE